STSRRQRQMCIRDSHASLLFVSSLSLVITALDCGPALDAPDLSGSASGSSSGPLSPTVANSTSGADAGTTHDTYSATTSAPIPPNGGDSTGSGDDTASSSGNLDASTGTPELDCDPLCDVVIDGGCLSEPDQCLEACESVVRDQGQAVADAFASCVATEFLCFSLLEDCMWSGLYGEEAVEQEYILEGQGFEAWNGQTVYAQVAVGPTTSTTESAAIENGEFAIAMPLSTPFDIFTNGRRVYSFVDVNDDGLCTPGVDHVQSDWIANLGSVFATLSFIIPSTPAKLSSDTICDHF
ncbi:MAG: hypothetical protein KUG77_00520, partial [Nannocystaceae bacterium]|nr:hypothetical protein [Nannocystaceae bacterium]